MLDIYFGDNLSVMRSFSSEMADLVYIDPPFNTGSTKRLDSIRIVPDQEGDRTGFGGKRYRSEKRGSLAYDDAYDEFMEFIKPRLVEVYRLMKPTASLFLHMDAREVHYCKVFLDSLFGRRSFINEIIWAYDYGGRSTKRWPAKHDTILWYAKDPRAYTFNAEAIDRIPYMAPKLVGEAKAERGKVPTDVWWNTIVSPTGRERTGYPTQKPLAILNRIVRVHSRLGDVVLDAFAGSGTTGEAAVRLGRSAVLMDSNPQAIEVMAKRLSFAAPQVHGLGDQAAAG